MASQKAIDNSKRLRYIRALERFHNSIISYLSNTQEITKEGYVKKVENALKILHRAEETMIYKGELKDLQNLVQKMISYQESEDDIDEIQNDILHRSNQLDKSKNARKYKKDKHQKTKFKDWN